MRERIKYQETNTMKKGKQKKNAKQGYKYRKLTNEKIRKLNNINFLINIYKYAINDKTGDQIETLV